MFSKKENPNDHVDDYAQDESNRIKRTLASLAVVVVPFGVYLNYMAFLNPDVNKKGLTDPWFDFMCLAPMILADLGAFTFVARQGKKIRQLRKTSKD